MTSERNQVDSRTGDIARDNHFAQRGEWTRGEILAETPDHLHRMREGPTGIGGWLIIPILGVIVTSAIALYTLTKIGPAVFNPGIWERGLAGGSIGWLIAVAFEINVNLTIVGFSAIVLRLIWLRSKRVPRLMMIWFVMAGAYPFIDRVLVDLLVTPSTDNAAFSAALRGVFMIAIWVPYFSRSNRVRNTFVEPV